MSRKRSNSVSIEEKSVNQSVKAEKLLTKAAAKTVSVKPSLKMGPPESRKAGANKKTSVTAIVKRVPTAIQKTEAVRAASVTPMVTIAPTEVLPESQKADADKTTSVTPIVIKVPPAMQPEEAKTVDKKALVAKGKKKRESKPKKEINDDIDSSDHSLSQDPDLMLGQRVYSTIITDPHSITNDELIRVNTRAGLTALLREKRINLRTINSVLNYEEELKLLQIELLKLQRSVQEKSERVVIIFEGRDAAGKGGTIRRFVEHLNPRAMRVVALPIPTKEEVGQWYFQRYIKQLPNPGEMVFFDRSWYNRAVVEPVNGFCTKPEYKRYMLQVPEFEHMLFEEGIHLIKFYFSISRKEQVKRFKARRENPLKQWKLSPLDARAQSLWDEYTQYKEMMFSRSHTTTSPWMIVQANNKLKARLESIRYVISSLEYEGQGTSKVRMHPDPNIVSRYNRDSISIE